MRKVGSIDYGCTIISAAASPSFADSPKAWTALAFTAAVPTSTRTLRLILGGTWATGLAVDSYFDVVEAELQPPIPEGGAVHPHHLRIRSDHVLPGSVISFAYDKDVT